MNKVTDKSACYKKLYKKSDTEWEVIEKKKFTREEDAFEVCKKINSNSKQIHKVVAYKCPNCRFYHIGKTNKELTNKDRKKIKNDW